MSAKEMFEELNFWERINDEWHIVYSYKNVKFTFYKRTHRYEIELSHIYHEDNLAIPFPQKIKKAINKQIEELEWYK